MKLWEAHRAFGRCAAVAGIAGIAVAVALLLGMAGVGGPVGAGGAGAKVDDFFYDAFYRMRPVRDMREAEVALVAVDEASLAAAGKPWPWPRTYWGEISAYLERAGARAIVFDIVFPNESYYGDDGAFAAAMNGIKVPVVYGATVHADGGWEKFAPSGIKNPTFGAVNLGADKVYRRYVTEKFGQPSEAEIAVIAAGMDPMKVLASFPPPPPPPAPGSEGFLLHYYGPHVSAAGQQTFRFVPAYNVLLAGRASTGTGTATRVSGSPGLPSGAMAALFKGKIVIICAIALGTFDLKTSPLSDEYPGPEIQATAIENMLHNQRVHVVPEGGGVGWLATIAAALLVAAGVVLPRRATIKVAVPVVVTAALLAACVVLFRGETIWWLSPVKPLAAIIVASPLAFGFTYFAEDRQRRFMLKALSRVVSPAVAQQLAREPQRLALGTVRTEITVLFTDLANFTDLSEGLDVQDLGKLVNRYLGEMSAQVIAHDGTLDKYIGDAVMCFWNAPLPQADHAVRACRTALAMAARERQLQEEFAGLAKKRIFTRIGVNSASVAVGFVGSEHLFNYTALGDGVNLASRIEGANKVYGSQILLAQSTALLVRERFFLRQLDVLRVKGKTQPMPVYELLAERGAGAIGGEAPDAAGDAPALEGRIRGYEDAFAAYQARDWDGAEKILLEVCGRFGEDGPAQALLARVRIFRAHPPAPDWDGVYEAKSK